MKKIYLLGLVFLFLSSFTFAIENSEFYAWYTFNDTLNDYINSYDLTGTPSYVGGISGNSLDCDGAENMNADSLNIALLNSTEGHICLWVNPDTLVGEQYIYEGRNSGDGNRLTIGLNGENLVIRFGDSEVADISSNITTTVWSHYCLTWDNIYYNVYMNSILVKTYDKSTKTFTAASFDEGGKICSGYDAASKYYNGQVDEWGFGSNNITQSDIDILYNDGSGEFYPFEQAGVSFVYPTPTTGTINNTQIIINISCLSGNVSLWFDNNTDPITLIDGGNKESPFWWNTNVTIEGTYYYKASCNDGLTNSSIRTWIYDISKPTITINSNNFFNENNLSNNKQYNDIVNLNLTFADNNDLFAYQINITKGGITYYNISNESISGTSYNLLRNINVSSWGSGKYNIEVLASDSHTAIEIPKYNIKETKNSLEFNTEAKNNIKVESIDNSITFYTKEKDRYSFTFEFEDMVSRTRTFKVYSENEIYYKPDSEYKAHFVIWNPKTKSGNWVDFEGVEGKAYVEKISNHFYLVTIEDVQKKVTFNSIGGLNVQTKNYEWYKGVSASNPDTNYTLQTAIITMTASIDSTITDINAELYYNGSIYYNPSKSSGATEYTFTREITVPEVNQSVNMVYYWKINSTQSDSSISESEKNFTQSIIFWGLDDCSTYTNISLNFTIVNEIDDTVLYSNLTGNFYYKPFSGTASKSYSLSKLNINNFSICITPEDVTLTSNYTIEYEGPAHPERRFGRIDDSLTNTKQDIKLYLLDLSLGIYARFKTVTILDEIITSVIGVMKKSGQTTIIESEITDGSGLATFFVNPNQDYDFTFSKTGYESVTETLRPTSSDIYNVIMGGGTTEVNTSVAAGVIYSFSPTTTVLNNNTAYNFNFLLNSTLQDITACTLYLKNSSGDILTSSSTSFSTSVCDITINYNTGNLTGILSEATYTVGDSTSTANRIYQVTHTYEGDYSLKSILEEIGNYNYAGFNNFTRLLITLVVMISLAGGLTAFGAFKDQESIIIFIVGIVWLLSFVNWFYITNPALQFEFIKKYGIALLISLIGGAYIIQRHG